MIINLQGQSSTKDESISINKNIILDYFGIDLKTTYGKAEKIIKDSRLQSFNKMNGYIRIFGKLSGIEKIKYTDLYFSDGVLTNIVVYIDRDSTYLDSVYNNLKNAIEINYKDQTKESAFWTNGNISLELKMDNTGSDNYKMISLHYYSNSYKKEIGKESGSKAISFSIGAGLGIGQTISFDHFLIPRYGYNDVFKFLLSAEILIPFNFSYFPAINFGIGVSFNLGIRPESYPFFDNAGLFNINMINNLMISNRFGLINKYYFLLEYGADFIPRFSIIYKPFFCAGPTVFFAFEMVSKKGFTLTLGNKFSVTFADNPNVSDGQKWTVTNMMIDFQIRFRYQHFKYLKNR